MFLVRKTNYISVPKGLSSIILLNRVDHKSISIFYCLKSLYVGGVIKNYRKRYSLLCEQLNISEKTLRTYIKILKDEKLVCHSNDHLFLVSSKKLKIKYGVSKYNHKIKVDDYLDYKKIQSVFVAISIKENYSQQEYVLKKRLTKNYIQEKSNFYKGEIYPRMINSYKERVKNHFNIFLNEEKKRFQKNVIDSVNNNKKIKLYNPDITLSRKGISGLKNCKSSYTGYSTIKKLKEYNLIKSDSNNLIKINNSNHMIYELYNNYRNLFSYKGSIYYRGVNSVVLNEDVYYFPNS